jgi:GNAT superfamily N-acetyltransferase
MRFTPDYGEQVVLLDATRLTLRLVRPDDKERLSAILAGMSVRSRTMRFFAPRTTLSDGELRYLTELDGWNHVAILALCGDESVGVGRIVRLGPGGRVAEPALAIVDHLQARGLGRILLDRLAAAARERGIVRLDGEVLPENRAMLRLLRSAPGPLALRVSRSSDGLSCSLDLTAHSYRSASIGSSVAARQAG